MLAGRSLLAPAGLVAAAVLAGCGDGNGSPRATPAHFEREAEAAGATLQIRGHNCSGIYGRWHVRIRVRGTASGAGKTAFTLPLTLRPGAEAEAPLNLRVHVGPLSGRASGTLFVSERRGSLHVRGLVRLRFPLGTMVRPVRAQIPIQRGAVAACR